MSITIILFILAIIINLIVTVVIVSRHSVSGKILKEIKPGVQSVVNDIDKRIVLLMDMMEEVESTKDNLINSATKKKKSTREKIEPPPSPRTSSDATHTIAYESKNESLHKDESGMKKNIATLLLNGDSIESVMETLGVSYEEVNIIRERML